MTAASAKKRTGPLRTLMRAGRMALVSALVGGVALAGNGTVPEAVVAIPTPQPTPTATPVPTPTPEPTPEPAPATIGEHEVREAQERLAALGYWVGAADGQIGPQTRHAITAFQKVEGRKRTGELIPAEVVALRSASRPSPRLTGNHWEVDLSRQVMWKVSGSSVSHILPISSGHGRQFTSQGWTRRAVTPRGRFRVQRKISGWRISPLGKLYYPSYLIGGIAVHGAPSVPPYPASAGCIRVPMFAAQAVYNMMPVGTPVIVHDGGPIPQERDIASPPGLDTPDASEPTTPDAPDETEASPTPEPEDPPVRTPRPPRTPEPTATPTPTPTPSPTPSATPSPTPTPTP